VLELASLTPTPLLKPDRHSKPNPFKQFSRQKKKGIFSKGDKGIQSDSEDFIIKRFGPSGTNTMYSVFPLFKSQSIKPTPDYPNL
jgi:hypothetical protein